jgi:LEA14-like dessication related protein
MYPDYLAFFCLIIVIGVLISGCGMLVKEPGIAMKNITIRSVTLSDIGIDITLSVNNPNPVGIRLKSVVFDVFYRKGNDWVYISHGEGGGYDIKSGMNEITVPVTVKSSELPGAGIGALLKGEITIQIRGAATPDFFGLAPAIPFTHTATIPVNLPGK